MEALKIFHSLWLAHDVVMDKRLNCSGLYDICTATGLVVQDVVQVWEVLKMESGLNSISKVTQLYMWLQNRASQFQV